MEQSQSAAQHHCKDCGVFFDSGKSLDVHLQYHKENLLSKWATSSAEESNNNNNVKQNHKLGSRVAQPDSSDAIMDRFSPSFNFSVNRSTPPNSFLQFSPGQNSDLRKTSDLRQTPTDMRPPSADMRPSSIDLKPSGSDSPKFSHNEEPVYILGSGADFPHRRTNTPNSTTNVLQAPQSNYRFHPYQHHPYSDRNNGIGSSSSPSLQRSETPQQCDKCGFICDSHQSLIEHLSTAHPPTPNINFNFNNGFDRQVPVKVEPQAEILDLDSHKVHVYQPPQGEQNQHSQGNELSLSWINNMGHDKKLFNPGNQINGNQMPSPDYNVTTTTMNPPSELLPQTYQYDHHINPQLPLQHPITTSSQVPLVNQHMQKNTGPTKSGGSWKSNEARRPKTYNCTACNKWFTSSGHLKRHYNTTLHKNAVKQSGAPDPAGLPISNHHHPQKEAVYSPQQESPPTSQMEEPPPILTPKMEEFERTQMQQHQQQLHFLGNPPNSLAGPSDISGGLLLPSTQQYQTTLQEEMRTIPSMQNQNFLPFPTTPMASYPQGSTIYPNFQPPRVTTPQTVTNITGNFDVQLLEHVDIHPIWARNTNSNYEPLPSFSHNFGGILPTFAPFHSQVVSTSNDNVGGLSPAHFESLYPETSPAGYSSDTIDTNTFSPQNLTNSESNSLDESTTILPSENVVSTSIEQEVELKIKQEENSVSSTIHDTIEKSPLQHRCDDCDKVFNKACYLTQHNKTFHTGDKPHKCEKCGKRFEIVSLLEEHMGKHAGEKPYKCEICPKQFNHKTDLRRHMCLHTGDKPFACSMCGKGFIRKDHMIKHLDTHKRKQNLAKQFPLQHKRLEAVDPLLLPIPVVQVIH